MLAYEGKVNQRGLNDYFNMDQREKQKIGLQCCFNTQLK